MKTFARISLFLIALLIICPQAGSAAFPFQQGETIRFQIKVFNIEVGYQDMTFLGETTLNGRRALHAIAVTKSLDSIRSMFNYSLHDVNEVWMDPDTLLPLRVTRDIQEGTWTDKVAIDMDQAGKTARYTDKRTPDGVIIPLRGATLDLLSLIYFVRAEQTRPGSAIDADYIVDNKQGVNKTRIIARKGDVISLSGTKVPTLWYEQEGGQGVKVRMTDDDKRIPLSITVGTFKVYGYTIDIVGSLAKYNKG
ncbi:MAG: DUF3108 domain-containing protein [Spirochaetota bacterium]|jgi:hypothetical protein|nr:DUF3108 domain-containing protein [Spirochaetota bacterium]